MNLEYIFRSVDLSEIPEKHKKTIKSWIYAAREVGRDEIRRGIKELLELSMETN